MVREKSRASSSAGEQPERHHRRGLPFTVELPRVVLVGSPNAGKSTLFNKMIRRRQAVVTDRPGTTRDWQIAEVQWAGKRFAIVDTGGLFGEDEEALRDKVLAKAIEALKGAHRAVLVVDSKIGVTGVDERVSEVLRKVKVPTVLAINKVDGGDWQTAMVDFLALGWEKMVTVSALHGNGVGDLLDLCVEELPTVDPEALVEPISVAAVGVPNAGKSSLMNALVGRERSIVHDKPGTTRDVLLDAYEWKGQTFVLADTAGVRRRAKVKDSLEVIAVSRSLGAAAQCDVTILIVDLVRGFTDQDTHLATACLGKGSGLVIFGNKLDLVKTDIPEDERLKANAMKKVMSKPFVRMGQVPVVLGSALKKQNLAELMDSVALVEQRQRSRANTPILNNFLQEIDGTGAFSGLSSPKILYGAQIGTAPPYFVIKVGKPFRVNKTGIAFLTRKLIERFDLHGCPIQVRVEGRRET